MIDTVIIAIILVLALLFLAKAFRRQPAGPVNEARANVKQGPVPGYSYLPGRFIHWDPSSRPMGMDDTWEAVSMETVHAGSRTRLVLSLRGRGLPSTDLFTLMKTLATRLLERTACVVVAVQFLDETSADRDDAILILASDGGGWTGTTAGATLTASLPGRPAFRLES